MSGSYPTGSPAVSEDLQHIRVCNCEERAETDAAVAVVGHLVAECLLVDEDLLPVEAPDGKPRLLGAWAVAEILGRLDAKGLAAEPAGAAASIRPLSSAAQPAEPNAFGCQAGGGRRNRTWRNSLDR
jgi:hypothetical protein